VAGASGRRRSPDSGLLALRLAIVAVAALAAAQPLLMTPWRVRAWDARILRAVVIDSSQSVPAAPASAAARDQEQSAFAAARFDGPRLPVAIADAVAWLDAAPPGRREVVLISDFQRGALDEQDL